MKIQSRIDFLFARQTFLLKPFSLPHYFSKFSNEENSLNKRTKVGAEISFVSRTENHLFMTRDLIDTIKTTPPSNTAFEGANFDTKTFLPAVRIKNTSVGAVRGPFYQIFSISPMRFFVEN